MVKKLVLTPYGYVEENSVIKIDNSMYVESSSDGNVLIKDRGSNALLKEHTKTCNNNDAKIRPNNYVGHTVVDWYITDIKLFKTTWIVPDIPKIKDSNNTYFLWNGLHGGALQPVLQWGNSEKGYVLRNWAFANDKYIHSEGIEVKPGDEITGVINLLKVEDDKWYYLVSFQDYPLIDLLVIRNTEAQGVMLCYESYTDEFDRIPSSLCCKMKNICVEMLPNCTKPTNFDWEVSGHLLPTPSGNNTVIIDNSTTNGEIDFYFH